MAGDHDIAGHKTDPIRIGLGADPLTCQLTRPRVTVALQGDQAGTGHPGGFSHIDVKEGTAIISVRS
jgi:hypothetical protein